jgi:hypothetical protein
MAGKPNKDTFSPFSLAHALVSFVAFVSSGCK